MKCPKCGSDNPEGTLFCENCNWRMDQPVKDPANDKIMYLTYAALVFGVVAVIVAVMKYYWFGVAFGVIGLCLAGYSLTAVRLSDIPDKGKKMLMIVNSVAEIVSVMGFILGLYYAVL
jgi:hypothetical protein